MFFCIFTVAGRSEIPCHCKDVMGKVLPITWYSRIAPLHAAHAILKHSESANLLRKLLLPHVWRGPSSKVLSCKHERLFDLFPLVLSEVLKENGQIATEYVPVDETGYEGEFNVNGSYMNIEGITSPDGRVLGKMAHSERRDAGVAVNIYGEQDIKIFESGVEYFK